MYYIRPKTRLYICLVYKYHSYYNYLKIIYRGNLKMRTLGNILLLPIKAIFLIEYILSLAGSIITIIFEHLSSIVIGMFISLCKLLVTAYLIFYGTGIFENPASKMAVIAFVSTIVISLIPLVFEGLQSFFKKGLTFWF